MTLTVRQAIDYAKLKLINDRALNAHLSRHKEVRIPIPLDTVPSWQSDEPPSNQATEFVIFRIKATGLMAEFRGHEEFAA